MPVIIEFSRCMGTDSSAKFELIIMGMALLLLHYNVGGSNVKDFFSGFLLGLSIVEMLVGVYVTILGLIKSK